MSAHKATPGPGDVLLNYLRHVSWCSTDSTLLNSPTCDCGLSDAVRQYEAASAPQLAADLAELVEGATLLLAEYDARALTTHTGMALHRVRTLRALLRKAEAKLEKAGGRYFGTQAGKSRFQRCHRRSITLAKVVSGWIPVSEKKLPPERLDVWVTLVRPDGYTEPYCGDAWLHGGRWFSEGTLLTRGGSPLTVTAWHLKPEPYRVKGVVG